MIYMDRISFLITLFVIHNVSLGMEKPIEKNLDQIAEYNRKIEEKQREIKTLESTKYFRNTSDQKAVKRLVEWKSKEIITCIYQKERLLSEISKL